MSVKVLVVSMTHNGGYDKKYSVSINIYTDSIVQYDKFMDYLYLIWFSLVFIALMYLVNALLARKFPRIEPRKLFVYVGGVAFMGVFGEVIIGSMFQWVFHWPLWQYHILPIHNAFTSYYSFVIWGIYGFHLYLLHGNISKTKKPLQDWKLASIFAFEAAILEIIINLVHIAVTGKYIFYYYPPDLFHLTSLVAIPLYFIGGYVIVLGMRRFTKDTIFFGAMCSIAVFTLLFLAT